MPSHHSGISLGTRRLTFDFESLTTQGIVKHVTFHRLIAFETVNLVTVEGSRFEGTPRH